MLRKWLTNGAQKTTKRTHPDDASPSETEIATTTTTTSKKQRQEVAENTKENINSDNVMNTQQASFERQAMGASWYEALEHEFTKPYFKKVHQHISALI